MTVRERRIPFMMSEAEVANLDQWRFTNRVPTRSEAIRQLVVNGMIDRPAGAAEPTNAIGLRDQFAMAALTGLMAYPGDATSGNWNNNSGSNGVAERCYELADAMLAAREAQP